MDWKSEAVTKLKQYKAKCEAMRIIPLEIQQINSSMDSIRSSDPEKIAVKGSGSGPEGKLLNCIMRKEELQRNMERAKLWVESVEKALAILNGEERRILERFYIEEERGAAEDLADEMFLDRKTVYHRKDLALWKFTTALYGFVGE